MSSCSAPTPNGGELTRGAVDVNLEGRAGDLTIATLTPGAQVSGADGGGAGRVQRIAISPTSGTGSPQMQPASCACPSTPVPRVAGIGFDRERR